ncbi:MAG: flagellar hook-basal body complex protein [Caulobacterales bacterium]
MSITSAELSGLSGLLANSAALSTLSNNIANVNTIGFKESNTDFETLVTSQASQNEPSSGGVAAVTQQNVTQQGVQNATSSPLDLSISGQGFFVTTNQAASASASVPAEFTRAGSFQVNSQGFLVNSAGLFLQGWPVNAQGNVVTNPSDLTQLQPINVSQVGGAVSLTTKVGINANLNAGQAISAAATAVGPPLLAGAYNVTTNSMAMYDANNATGVKPDFSIQIPVSDSKGGKRTVEIDFLKSTTPNQWYSEMVAIPASDVNEGAGLTNGQIATGIVAFTPSGQLDPVNTTLFNAANPSISFGASNGAPPAAGTVNWAVSLGIAAQTVAFNVSSSATGGLTQLDSPSDTQSITTNGTAFGNLSNIQIDTNGFVTAVFSNGVTKQLAQVGLATFPNPDGLTAVSGNAYQVSQQSGTFTLNLPGAGGAGRLDPSTLEASTVDLSTEFTNLITTQRAYTASSKIITTADQMTQDLLSIIR